MQSTASTALGRRHGSCQRPQPYYQTQTIRRVSCRASLSTLASSTSGGQQQQVVDSLQQQLQQLQQVQLPDSQQSLQAVQQYGGQAAAAAGAAWSNVISPFAVFGDSWGLNILFIGSITLLVYSLLILAPRQ